MGGQQTSQQTGAPRERDLNQRASGSAGNCASRAHCGLSSQQRRRRQKSIAFISICARRRPNRLLVGGCAASAVPESRLFRPAVLTCPPPQRQRKKSESSRATAPVVSSVMMANKGSQLSLGFRATRKTLTASHSHQPTSFYQLSRPPEAAPSFYGLRGCCSLRRH